MLHVTVKGGTNAGRRRVKQATVWTCCGTVLRTYSCPGCGTRRPA